VSSKREQEEHTKGADFNIRSMININKCTSSPLLPAEVEMDSGDGKIGHLSATPAFS
jgi:hypothetical protein